MSQRREQNVASPIETATLIEHLCCCLVASDLLLYAALHDMYGDLQNETYDSDFVVIKNMSVFFSSPQTFLIFVLYMLACKFLISSKR